MSLFYSNQNLSNNYRHFFLLDYKVEMLIGFLAHEKIKPQSVIFNIDIFVPLNQSASISDNVKMYLIMM